MSSAGDEFPSPLRIYHSTRDANGERRPVRLMLPAEWVNEMERYMRSQTTYLSLHQYMINCMFYGSQALEQQGMADSSVVFEQQLQVDDLAAQLAATQHILDKSRQLWQDAKTPYQRARVSAQIREVAGNTSDPQVANQLRQIVEN